LEIKAASGSSGTLIGESKMSQEKVDRYKEQKKNRKKIQAKKKREVFLLKACGGLIVVALVGWIGFSAFDNYMLKVNSTPITADITALNDYVTSLNAE